MTVNEAITLMIQHTDNVDTYSMIEIYEPRICNNKNHNKYYSLISDFSVWLYGVDYPEVKKEHKKAKHIPYAYKINNIITSTTRDKRANEVDGVDYYFYTSEQMTEKLLNDELAEAVVFNGWVYATEYKALSKDKINVGIYNLAGAEALAQNPELETYII